MFARSIMLTALACSLGGMAQAQGVVPDPQANRPEVLPEPEIDLRDRPPLPPRPLGDDEGIPGVIGTNRSTIGVNPLPPRAGRYQPEEIRRILGTLGYERIGPLQRAGESYTGRAELLGEEVELRVSALTGSVEEPAALSEAQTGELLRRAGYTTIGGLERDGAQFRGVARSPGGDRVTVIVSTLTGLITEANPRQ